MNDDQQRLLEARDLIKQKKFSEARAVLLTVQHHPKAQEWLQKLDQLAPAPPPPPKPSPAAPRRPTTTEQADDVGEDFFSADPLGGVQAPPEARAANDPDSILREARALIKADRIDEAREKLLLIADHPKAQNWLMRLGSIGVPAQQVAQQADDKHSRHRANQAPPAKSRAGSSRRPLLMVILLLFVLVAAVALVVFLGGGDDDGDDDAADASPELTQQYQSADGRFSIRYPAGLQVFETLPGEEAATAGPPDTLTLFFAASEDALAAVDAGNVPDEGVVISAWLASDLLAANLDFFDQSVMEAENLGDLKRDVETGTDDGALYRHFLARHVNAAGNPDGEVLWLEYVPQAGPELLVAATGAEGMAADRLDLLLEMARSACLDNVCADGTTTTPPIAEQDSPDDTGDVTDDEEPADDEDLAPATEEADDSGPADDEQPDSASGTDPVTLADERTSDPGGLSARFPADWNVTPGDGQIMALDGINVMVFSVESVAPGAPDARQSAETISSTTSSELREEMVELELAGKPVYQVATGADTDYQLFYFMQWDEQTIISVTALLQADNVAAYRPVIEEILDTVEYAPPDSEAALP